VQEVFKLLRSKSGSQIGEFRATGLRPSFLEALELNGATFSEDTFHPGATS